MTFSDHFTNIPITLASSEEVARGSMAYLLRRSQNYWEYEAQCLASQECLISRPTLSSGNQLVDLSMSLAQVRLYRRWRAGNPDAFAYEQTTRVEDPSQTSLSREEFKHLEFEADGMAQALAKNERIMTDAHRMALEDDAKLSFRSEFLRRVCVYLPEHLLPLGRVVANSRHGSDYVHLSDEVSVLMTTGTPLEILPHSISFRFGSKLDLAQIQKIHIPAIRDILDELAREYLGKEHSGYSMQFQRLYAKDTHASCLCVFIRAKAG